jgi:hypothetical protein
MSEVVFKRGATGEIIGAKIVDEAGEASPPGAWRKVANAVRAVFDRNELNAERITQLENRLAKLDRGVSSDKAKWNAYNNCNVDRRSAGKGELSFQMSKPK